ncbi:HAD family hydrolase [Brassicibacter mesophilus]|uniref:HAD family hydrolase n=1 Tax=Brassicibacter mesophilus TaxID=745119 RepID=UPI003D1C9450
MEYKLICIDMFQTLVDVNTRIPFIWKRILKDRYTSEAKEKCVKLVSRKFHREYYNTVSKIGDFQNLKTIFTPWFEEISSETKLDFNPHNAVEIFLCEHGNSSFYDDTIQFFQLINGQVPICLVSDADEIMVEPLLEKFKFDTIFISERIGSYKNDRESRIFLKVLEHYHVKPEMILHIGDSASDIVGANKVGIKSCWINRNGIKWEYDEKPDYTIKSLIEAVELIT